jgi:iron complex transport system permease protein
MAGNKQLNSDRNLTASKLMSRLILAFLLLLVVMFICSFIGTQKISLANVLQGKSDQPGQNIDYEIFFGIRIPRLILAALVGAALACSGVAFQAILRNPLADPYILGISSGAGLGVILAVLTGFAWTVLGSSVINLFAFVTALLTVWLVWFIGHFTSKSNLTSLLLAGVVVNAFFSAVIMFLTSIASSSQLRSTIMWLMGNITEKDTTTLSFSAILILAGLIGLFYISNKLNIISFGEDEAKSLGINSSRVRIVTFAIAAFITSIAVSLSGLIGFVGLIIPHAVRLVFGPDHRQLLPLSAIIGSIFLVIADTIAKNAQLPVGVITALAGGPFFLVLLAKYTRKVSWLK